MELVINDRKIGDFVALNSDAPSKYTPENSVCFGLLNKGNIVGGVVFNDYNGRHVKMHVSSDGNKRWLNKSLIYSCMHYAFCVMNVRRITAEIDASNDVCIRNAWKMGFEVEALLKDAGPKTDLMVMVMFKERCKYLEKAVNYVSRRR